MKALGFAFLFSLLTLGGVSHLQGQLIRGRVLSEGDLVGVDGAELTLLDSLGATVALARSDSTGAFALSVPEPGSYVISATRIGFAPVHVDVAVGEKEIVEVELKTAHEAIPLDPIVVVARRQIRQGTLDEFYDRMARMKQRGSGFFFTPEDVARYKDAKLTFMLQTAPGVFSQSAGGSDYEIRMMGPRGSCSPIIYLDGIPMSGPGAASGPGRTESYGNGLYPFGDGGGGAARPRYSTLQTLDLEGVEVYRGRFENADGYWPSDCGSIFLWRKEGWGGPFTVGNLLMGGGLMAAFLLLATLF
jgi:hypothetical protein